MLGLVVATLIGLTAPAQADRQWNMLQEITGIYTVQTFTNSFTLNVTHEDFSTGVFEGTFYAPSLAPTPATGQIYPDSWYFEVPTHGLAFWGPLRYESLMRGDMYYDAPGTRWTGFWSATKISCKGPGLDVPSSVYGGQQYDGFFSIDHLATASSTVRLSTTNPAVHVPTPIPLPIGKAITAFQFSTDPVSRKTYGQIIARQNGVVVSRMPITVIPNTLASLELEPATLAAGEYARLRIHLTGPPPPNLVVLLHSSNPKVAAIQSSILMRGGTAEVTVVTASPLSARSTVTLTAKCGSVLLTKTLTVDP